jgi:hypothetical protein
MGRRIGLAAAAVAIIVVGLNARAPSATLSLIDIEPQGAAAFASVQGDLRTLGWTVTCSAPLRGCVARSHGAVLRVDANGLVWLSLAVSPEARLAIPGGLFADVDATALLRRPVDPKMLRLMSRPGTHLVVEDPVIAVPPLPTAGIEQVVSYLSWLQSPLARTLRDARLWRADGSLDLTNADPDVRERYRLLTMRAGTGEDGGRFRVAPSS